MNVKVYTTATCAYCQALKKFLKENNVEFKEVAVDQDQDAAREMYELSGQLGVPFTVIEDDKGDRQGIIGFDQPQIKEALGI